MRWKIRYKKFLRSTLYSVGLAFFMLYIALGLLFLKLKGASPLPMPVILLITAIFFVIFSVLSELKGQRGALSLLKSFFFSICATFSTVTIFCGIILSLSGEIPLSGDELISALAVCMIISTVLLSLLRPASR
ncbi:MAG: heat-shock protein [Candidatus Methanospirareceae archaeon]